MPSSPQPLAAASFEGVVGVMTDIDDTLTHAGAIEPAALAALHALRDAGLPVIAITGRPRGWSEPFAATWPVAAIVAENGGVALVPKHGQLHIEHAQDAPTRAANKRRLHHAAACVLAEVPGARLAQDSAGRDTDIAVDHGEFARLDAAQIEHVVAVMRREGLHASVSSIHVNGWIGSHTKLSGAAWMLERLFGRALQPEVGRWVYVGDSTNDQVMFAAFPLGVGVANLRRFAAELQQWPAYITESERGAGFAEVARAVLAARR